MPGFMSGTGESASARQIPGVRVFHGVEKNFPWCGKLLAKRGAAG